MYIYPEHLKARAVTVSYTHLDVYKRQVREGYSGGYYTEGYGFEESVDTGDIYYHLYDCLLYTSRCV